MGTAMSGVNLAGYVDVATRRRLAVERWPELRIVEGLPEIVTVADSMFVQVTVTVYRDPADPMPTRATVWERLPGRTPYTRDSEVMNAATSALGRALGYMGVGVETSLSTRDEIALRASNAEPERPNPKPENTARPAKLASQPQLAKINVLLTTLAVIERPAKLDVVNGIVGRNVESAANLTAAEASHVIDVLTAKVDALPDGGE